MLMERAWERIFVLCTETRRQRRDITCAQHREGIWWPSIRKQVTLFSAEWLDAQHRATLSAILGNRSTRGQTHAARTLLSHLWLVSKAARDNLTSVLIIEADVREALMFQRGRNALQTESIASNITASLASESWSVFRLSALFSDFLHMPTAAAAANGTFGRCVSRCHCRPWAARSVSSDRLSMCTITPRAGVNVSKPPTIPFLGAWCRARSTEAYAVHRKAFPVFTTALQWYLEVRRVPAGHVPFIDDWLPSALPNTYVTPSLVTQRGNSIASRGIVAMESADKFRRHCVPDSKVFTAW